MSIRGFLQSLRAIGSKPDYLKNMTPEELAERRRRRANQNWFGIQIFDPPKPRSYKAPKSHVDKGSASD
jgi:hypothetical protein